MGNSVSMQRYCVIYALVYAGCLALINVLGSIAEVNLGSGGNAGALVGSAYIAVSKFVRDNGRVPDTAERRRLTWGSILASYLVSLLAVWAIFTFSSEDHSELFDMIARKGVLFLAGVSFVIITLFYYLMLGVCFYLFGKIAARHYQPNNA